MASFVAPVPSLPVPHGAPCTQGAEAMDWEDVSVKDEPPDGPTDVAPLPGELTAMNDDFEDTKNTITVNSLGEVHYLPAGTTATYSTGSMLGAVTGAVTGGVPGGVTVLGDVVTDGVTVKVEEDMADMDPLTIAPIKEEEEEAATSGTVATSDLSYLDDPRWYMSPEDREIDPEASYQADSDVITVGPSTTLVSEYTEGGPSTLQAGAVSTGRVQGVTGVTGSVEGVTGRVQGVSKAAKSKVSKQGVPKQGVQGVSKRGVRPVGKADSEGGGAVLPCVVQLCQVHHCGVDCRCTVRAPYPAKLNAVTISTEQNLMSLNRFSRKGSRRPGSKPGSQPATQPPPGSSLLTAAPNMAADRTGRGKRPAKLSPKLRQYMEERHAVGERHRRGRRQAGTEARTFVCPICDKGFSYIFSFKQHIITHDVTEILNMNLPPRSKTILPTGAAQGKAGQAGAGQEETGQTGPGQEETVQEETGLEETGQEQTGLEETGLEEAGQAETGEGGRGAAGGRYRTLRTLLSDEVAPSSVDTHQVLADTPSTPTSNKTTPSTPTSNKTTPSKKGRTPSKKTNSPSKTSSPVRTKTLSPATKQTDKKSSPARKQTETVDKKTSPSTKRSDSKSSPKKAASPNSKKTVSSKQTETSGSSKSSQSGVVLKVPSFKPKQKKKPAEAAPAGVELSSSVGQVGVELSGSVGQAGVELSGSLELTGSLGLGEVVMYERGMKVNEATFTVEDGPAPQQPEPEAAREEEPGPAVQQEPVPLREPGSQHVIVIAPINDFSPLPGADDCRDASAAPQANDGQDVAPGSKDRDVSVSPKAKPTVGVKPVKRLKKGRAKPALKVKLNLKQKPLAAAIKKSPASDESPPPLVKRSPSRAKSSPTLQIKTSPRTSPKSSPRAKPKVAALKGEQEERNEDSDATSPYGDDDDDDDRDADFSPDDEDEDYVPSKKGSSRGALGKSASMVRWMKQFSVKRNQLHAKYRANTAYQPLSRKRGGRSNSNSKGAEGAKVSTSPTNSTNTNTNSRRGQSRSLGGNSAHNNNNNKQQQPGSDPDSGIDLESDGSEHKKSLKAGSVAVGHKAAEKKPGVSVTARELVLQDGRLVSRQELWVCVQGRLDGRRQKEAVLCPMCDKEFHYPSALKRHVMMHTDEREYQCPQCPKAFSRKPHLTEHIRVHTGERPFKCSHCPAAFAQRTNLKIHNRTHTGARPFKCPECGKRFRRQDAHTQHILTHHSKVKPYKCSECSAAFPCARYLKDHLRVHSTERPFKCEMCPAAFVCKKYLLLHVRALHLNERPFCCKLCPAKFAQSGKLTEHNRVHTGERPYKCSSCGASFSRSGHLRRHLLTHTGVRPHQCGHCDASFSQQDHLKRHVKNIHRTDV